MPSALAWVKRRPWVSTMRVYGPVPAMPDADRTPQPHSQTHCNETAQAPVITTTLTRVRSARVNGPNAACVVSLSGLRARSPGGGAV